MTREEVKKLWLWMNANGWVLIDQRPAFQRRGIRDGIGYIIFKSWSDVSKWISNKKLEAGYECAKDGVLTIRESVFEKGLEALKEPLRNFEIGTEYEQSERFKE